VRDPAHNGNSKGLDPEERAHVRRDVDEGRDEHAGAAREDGRQRIGRGDRTSDVNPHQLGRLRVLHDGQQGLALTRGAAEQVQRAGDCQPDERDTQLQRRHAQPSKA
jgi:hypothetical protein